MAVLRDFAGLLAVYPGSLVYHLVALFASQVVLGIALVAWRQRRDSPLATRLLALAGALALTRVVLITVAGLDQAGIVWGEAVLPPLERFLDFVTLFVSTWTFLPVLMRYRRIGTALLVAGLVAGAGIYILTAFLWLRRVLEGSFYNHYWQSSAWEVLSGAILLPTLFVAALSRHDDWGLLTCLFALWLAGHSLEYAAPIVDSNAAGWVRVASLVALPVFTGLVYRTALRVSPSRDSGLPAPLISALATLSRAVPAGDIENGLRLTAPALAETLGADVVALAASAPREADQLRVVALHPPRATTRRGRKIEISGRDHPALRAVFGLDLAEAAVHPAPIDSLDAARLQTGQRLGHDPLSSARDVEAGAQLFRSLGFDRSGPLIVHPLRDGGTIVGAILAGNPISQRGWDEGDRQVLDVVGPAIAAALSAVQRRRTRDWGAELRRSRARERGLAGRVAELEEQLTVQGGRLAAMAAGRNEYRRMTERLAARLRQYEREERGAGEPPPAISGPVDIGASVAAAAASLSKEFRERGLTLRRDIPAGLPPADADRGSVLRIVANVLQGACLASPEGAEIVVRARRVAADGQGELPLDSLLVSVGHGGGVSGRGAEEPEHGGEERAGSRSRVGSIVEAEASLSAARALVQDLGGLVWMESEQGLRSTFSFTLPVSPRSEQAPADSVGRPLA